MRYNKLVRDKIPEIITAKGGVPITHIATTEEYNRKIREKLQEEINEFLKDNTPGELADILEVVYAIAAKLGMNKDELEQVRVHKIDERGGFVQGIILDES